MKQRLYRLPLEANLVISQVTIWGTQRHNKATSTYSRGHLVRRQAIEILTLVFKFKKISDCSCFRTSFAQMLTWESK
ncbi:hypothetical protein F2Q69_00050322 [Brassica cretica]|uniref:Uncharacterized protein n=1 Tax=Brassica cretica TaxID=69181 RepID=A0A8S9PW48_BRACR|nr:hypothetical protein F2Q69_00050322 [Brassica cretica]